MRACFIYSACIKWCCNVLLKLSDSLLQEGVSQVSKVNEEGGLARGTDGRLGDWTHPHPLIDFTKWSENGHNRTGVFSLGWYLDCGCVGHSGL